MLNTPYHFNPDDPYPDSDRQPMAEKTEQYEWLVKIKENLEILFAGREDVFVAGDLFWNLDSDRRIVDLAGTTLGFLLEQSGGSDKRHLVR